jgi:hypothetical protein
MKKAAILFLVCFISAGISAQRSYHGKKNDRALQGDSVPAFLAKNTGDSATKKIPANLSASLSATAIVNDTSDSTGEIPQGVIRVHKPDIKPYVKVEYKYYLSHVNMVKVDRPVDNGIMTDIQTDNVPQFDSNMYSQNLKREYPKKAPDLFSKMFYDNMKYRYNVSDTPRVDTMVIGMWIDTHGKVKRVLDDPEYTLKMPDEMVNELTRTGMTVTNWGQPGGFYPKKKLFRKAPLTFESYYVEVFVIVSSYPLTQEQKITQYAPFDYPLNSPPVDEQEKKSIEKNGAVQPKLN